MIRTISYKERAEFYDLDYSDKNDHYLMKHFIASANNILEIPCGTGRNLDLYISFDNKDVTFIDLEKNMITQIHEKVKERRNFTCRVGNILNLSLNKSFDLILVPKEAFQQFTNLYEAELALLNLKEHLTSDGKIYIDIYNFISPRISVYAPSYYNGHENRYYRNYKRNAIERWSKYESHDKIFHFTYVYVLENDRCISEFWLKNYTYIEFKDLCKKCGLKVVKVYGGYEFESAKLEGDRLIFILEEEKCAK